MFHVSTLLPYSFTERQQLERKRHIGNDIVVIIFQEGVESTYIPTTIKTQFNHILVIVQADTSPDEFNPNINRPTRYKIQIARKQDVVECGPSLPYPPVFEHGLAFKNMLLTKLINAERAAYKATMIRGVFERARQGFLNHWLQNYSEKE